jgi:hypothetical protein
VGRGDLPTSIQSAGDLLAAVGQFLTSLGLEPDVRGDALDFLHLGDLHRIEPEGIVARLDRAQVSDAERGMLAGGFPAG